jgi:hypothetical protein
MARDDIIRPENPQYDELAHLCNRAHDMVCTVKAMIGRLTGEVGGSFSSSPSS